MRTALFPLNDQHITLKQGKTGDCYLLTVLDCILNSGPKGQQIIKSMFTETDSGVFVRIKRNAQSGYLKWYKENGALRDKYVLSYDSSTDEDVLFIDNNYLQEIDNYKGGVKSNSLAIKILERIITYFYSPDENLKKMVANSAAPKDALYKIDSVIQHNRYGKTKNASSETQFLAQIFDIDALDLDSAFLIRIIYLKKNQSKLQIYISMDYGIPDKYGKIHTAHALRLHSVEFNPNIPGDYKLHLINPWDNTLIESYNYEQIRDKHPKFCIFNLFPDLESELLSKFGNWATCSLQLSIKAQITDTATQEDLDTISWFRPNRVNKELVKNIIDTCKLDYAIDLMRLLYKIHPLNYKLSNKLFEITKDNIPTLFKDNSTYYETSNEAMRSINASFKTWFTSMSAPTQNSAGAGDMKVLTRKLADEINAFEVLYNECKDRTEIINHRDFLLSELNSTTDEYNSFPEFSNLINQPIIQTLFENKKASIYESANKLINNNAKTPVETILEFVLKIMKFTPSCAEHNSNSEDCTRTMQLLKELDAIRYYATLTEALKSNDVEIYAKRLDKEYEAKKSEILNGRYNQEQGYSSQFFSRNLRENTLGNSINNSMYLNNNNN